MAFLKKLINKLSTGGHGQDAVGGVARERGEGGGKTVGEQLAGVERVPRLDGGGVLNAIERVADGEGTGNGDHGGEGLWLTMGQIISRRLANCKENLSTGQDANA